MAKPKHTLASIFEDKDSPTPEPPSPGRNVNDHRRQAARAAIKSDDKRLEDFNMSQDLQNIQMGEDKRLPPEGAVSAYETPREEPNLGTSQQPTPPEPGESILDSRDTPAPSTIPEGWTRSAEGVLSDEAGREYKPLAGQSRRIGDKWYGAIL